ncbi:FkbM family methyltransferase [Botrimarina hoheduenensis]|nr:FkbM family methyltransferase [Botrimarina hoheduenensis]
MRHFLERVSRGRTFQRRLSAEFGRRPIIVSPDAALRYLSPTGYAFESALLDVAAEWVRPGDTAWDIGSNLGVFAVAAGHCAGSKGRVLAVEADGWLASVIRRTCSLPDNRDLAIEVLPAAISTEAGAARFAIAERGRASNALAEVSTRATTGGVRETQLVPTLPMDALLEVAPGPRIIKIDVEGAEVLVLRGANRVLSEARPVVYIEVGKENADEVTKLLTDADYVLLNPEVTPLERRPLERCVFNTLAVPRDQYAPPG